MEKNTFQKNLKKKEKRITVKENRKKLRCFKFERTTYNMAASIQSLSFKLKLADSSVGVAPNEFPRPIIRRISNGGFAHHI